MDARRRRGEPVLPLAFGEAGLPAHRTLRAALARAAGCNSYGPVAGHAPLREAVAGYWARRGLPTDADAVVCGPGSKALLFGLIAAIGGPGARVAVTRPSWVSYAAQAALSGRKAHSVPDPGGLLAPAGAVRDLGSVAEACDLVIISDEIYRDLVHDPAAPFTSPAVISPERTVVTAGLSKSLALGGWRLGVARLPAGEFGRDLRDRLLGIGSEIWSAPAGPVQQAAALAFSEPPELAERVALSRRLHRSVARAAAHRFAAAGAEVPAPQAAFYLYPDFTPLAGVLLERHGITSDESLASVLLHEYGAGVLPGSAFGDDGGRLRLRVATALLYGGTDDERHAALDSADPCSLPWIAGSLDRLEEVLADLTG